MEVCDETVNEICQLKWLKGLYLSCNNLTNASVRKIAEELPHLEELSLGGNRDIDDISPCKNMKQLKVFWINGTKVRLTFEDMDWLTGPQFMDVDFEGTPTEVEEYKYFCKLWARYPLDL